MIVTKVILIIGYVAHGIVRPGTMNPRYKNRDVRSAFVTVGVVRSAFVTIGDVRSAFVTTGDVRSATSPVTVMTVVVY